MVTKKRVALGLIALLAIVLIITPSTSEAIINLVARFLPEDPDPEFITTTVTQPSVTYTQPPVTQTATITQTQPTTTTQKITVGVSTGTIEITGILAFYDIRGMIVKGTQFKTEPSGDSDTESELHEVRLWIRSITIKGKMLDPASIEVRFYLKLDVDSKSYSILKSDTLRRNAFDKGDGPFSSAEFSLVAEDKPVYDDRIDLDEAASIAGINRKIDGTKWNFRVKAKATLLTPKGNEWFAVAEKRFTLTTDWCADCGGILQFRDLTASQWVPPWEGGFLSVIGSSVGGLPVVLLVIPTIYLGWRWYKQKR